MGVSNFYVRLLKISSRKFSLLIITFLSSLTGISDMMDAFCFSCVAKKLAWKDSRLFDFMPPLFDFLFDPDFDFS
jgi:hypothetical protein